MVREKRFWVKENGTYWDEVYTLEELKMYFEPVDTDGELLVGDELLEQYEAISTIEDLEEFLRVQADGMAVPYKFMGFYS